MWLVFDAASVVALGYGAFFADEVVIPKFGVVALWLMVMALLLKP